MRVWEQACRCSVHQQVGWGTLKDPTVSWHKRLVPCTGCTAYPICLHALCMWACWGEPHRAGLWRLRKMAVWRGLSGQGGVKTSKPSANWRVWELSANWEELKLPQKCCCLSAATLCIDAVNLTFALREKLVWRGEEVYMAFFPERKDSSEATLASRKRRPNKNDMGTNHQRSSPNKNVLNSENSPQFSWPLPPSRMMTILNKTWV